MMKIKLLLPVVFGSVLILYLVSCSKDDDKWGDPAGTITLNMLNEKNGAIQLGFSQVYIDNANNFCSSHYLINNLGERKGLGNIPAPVPIPDNMATRVAVQPGYAYQFLSMREMREFPSGTSALCGGSKYYNVYVVSDIVWEKETVGATVKFVLMDVPYNGLPEYNTKIGVLNYTGNGDCTLDLELPTTDFEYELHSSGWNEIELESQGNKLIVRLVEYNNPDTFDLYVRAGDVYTYLYGEVK